MTDRPTVTVVATWLPTARNPMMGVFVERDIRALATVADMRVVHLVGRDLDDGSRTARIGDVPVTRVPMRWNRPADIPGARRRLEDLVRGSDIVHTMAMSALVPFGLRRPRQPWVHTEHWSGFATLPGTARARVGMAGVVALERKPDVVAAVSTFLAERIESRARRGVTVVPNIVDAGELTERPARADDDPLRLVAVGGMIPRKGPLVAVRACAELRRRGVRASLTWVGDGDLRTETEDLARELGVPLDVTGFVAAADVPGRIARADAMLLPTNGETFCLAAAEALGGGRPVVVGALGGQADFTRPPAGALVEGDDPADYADAVQRVLADTAGIPAEEIAREVRRDYTAGALAGRYAAIYTALLDGGVR